MVSQSMVHCTLEVLMFQPSQMRAVEKKKLFRKSTISCTVTTLLVQLLTCILCPMTRHLLINFPTPSIAMLDTLTMNFPVDQVVKQELQLTTLQLLLKDTQHPLLLTEALATTTVPILVEEHALLKFFAYTRFINLTSLKFSLKYKFHSHVNWL